MKLDKVLLAIIIVIVVLTVILATHTSTPNTVISASKQTTPHFDKMLVYNTTANTSMLYYITPDPASIEENASSYQPMIIDHGDGNVTFLIAPAVNEQDNPEGISITYYFMADASVYYEINPTVTSISYNHSSHNPLIMPIVGHIYMTDDITSSDHKLSITIIPRADGSGIVSLTALTPKGKYSISGTIQDPLNIQEQPVYDMGFGYLVKNDSIQYDNQTLKLATIHARNKAYYVLFNDSIQLE